MTCKKEASHSVHTSESSKEKTVNEMLTSQSELGMTLGLDRMERALKDLNHPEKKLSVIHIAGTNGKGSVAQMLQQVLAISGYRVGVYTSPQIAVYEDRFQINGKNIARNTLLDIFMRLKPLVDRYNEAGSPLSVFELETLAAILYFNDAQVDVAIFEVGLGGKFDATNIFPEKLVDVFTQIGRDHVGILGDDLKDIAAHKGAIIQCGDQVVIGPNTDEVVQVLQELAALKKATVRIVDEDDADQLELERSGSWFQYREVLNLFVSLPGQHQVHNALTTLATLETLNQQGYKISDESVVKGFKHLVWPNRLQWVTPRLLFDGAHNMDAATALVRYLEALPHSEKILIVWGSLKDKDYRQIMEQLQELPADFILTEVPFSDRALAPSELEKTVDTVKHSVEVETNYAELIRRVIVRSPAYDFVVIGGSLYLLDALKNHPDYQWLIDKCQ